MSLKDRFDTAMSISCAFCEQTEKPISKKNGSRKLNKEKLEAQVTKKNQKVHHRAYHVDRGTMEYGSL